MTSVVLERWVELREVASAVLGREVAEPELCEVSSGLRGEYGTISVSPVTNNTVFLWSCI